MRQKIMLFLLMIHYTCTLFAQSRLEPRVPLNKNIRNYIDSVINQLKDKQVDTIFDYALTHFLSAKMNGCIIRLCIWNRYAE